MDAKGRFGMPTRYRDEIAQGCQGKLVITIDALDPCLLIYPIHEWEIIQAQIEALPNLQPASRRLQRMLIGHATDLELDANGRLLLPPVLREYAGLDKKLMLLGQGKKFELWNEERWNACRENYLNESDAQALPEEMMTLSL
jgi:MraZ protein